MLSTDIIQTMLITANTLGLGWLVVSRRGTKNIPYGSLILDSCALIDGRIADIAKTGLLAENIVLPKFILDELQLLADGRDSHKRARARYGLEVADSLRLILGEKLLINTNDMMAQSTDDKLIELAKNTSARLCTTDYNLNKVASVHGIEVLNINELALAMRKILLPGEEQQIKILQKGEGHNQGVGYLSDGTLVIVDGARKYIGTEQLIIIDRSLQTVAGKMCFAHLKIIK